MNRNAQQSKEQVGKGEENESPPKQSPLKQSPLKQNPLKQNPLKQNPPKQNPPKQNPLKENPLKQNPLKQNPPIQYVSLLKQNPNDGDKRSGVFPTKDNGDTSRVRLMLIDYGKAQSGNRSAGYKCTAQAAPQIAPELCLYSISGEGGSGNTPDSDLPGVLPHPTSDLHSIACVISTISKELNMAGLSKDMDTFMGYSPQRRQVDFLKRSVEKHFKEFTRESN